MPEVKLRLIIPTILFVVVFILALAILAKN